MVVVDLCSTTCRPKKGYWGVVWQQLIVRCSRHDIDDQNMMKLKVWEFGIGWQCITLIVRVVKLWRWAIGEVNAGEGGELMFH